MRNRKDDIMRIAIAKNLDVNDLMKIAEACDDFLGEIERLKGRVIFLEELKERLLDVVCA